MWCIVHLIPYIIQTNTYQAVVISDGTETYSIFTYNCEQLHWIGEVGNYASVGFNVLSNMENFPSFANHDLSRTPNVGMLACNHTSQGVPWTNTIYRIGVSVSDLQRNRSWCLDQVAKDELRYNVSTENIIHNLPAELSDCPCSIFQVQRDPRFFSDANATFLDEADCYFSRFPSTYSSDSTIKMFYRCCYSTKWVKCPDHHNNCKNYDALWLPVYFNYTEAQRKQISQATSLLHLGSHCKDLLTSQTTQLSTCYASEPMVVTPYQTKSGPTMAWSVWTLPMPLYYTLHMPASL